MKHFLRTSVVLCFLFPFFLNAQKLSPKAIKGSEYVGMSYDTCYALFEPIESTILNKNPRFKKLIALRKKNTAAYRSFQNSLATSEIIINFSPEFEDSPEARDAFRFAADMWELEVVSSVPIIIDADFQPLGEGTIGQNGSPSVINVPNAPDPSIAYVTSLANAIAGEDLLPGEADLNQTYNSEFEFYFGIDADPPTNQFDFVTIAFHEIGHGMGISASTEAATGVGVGGNDGRNPRAWDSFMFLGDDTYLMDLGFGSPEQVAALISNDLFISSFNTNEALEGQKAKIFAPDSIRPGSSISHWDEATFPADDPNTLMTPFANRGQAVHDIGDITRGILRDMGWELASKESIDVGIATITSPVSGQDLTGNESVTVVIGNVGLESVSNIPVTYTIDGVNAVTEIFTGTIAPNEEVEYTFNTTADLSESDKTYNIEASIDLFIDTNPVNDGTFKNVTHLLPVTGFPYQVSFENGANGWVAEGDDGVWELATPSGQIISGAPDGEFAWVTNAGGNYPDQSTSWVLSPVFDLSNFQDPTFSFDIFYDIETGWDGTALQVSTDQGTTWATVGEFGDDNNWYTDGDRRSAAGDGSEGEDGIDALSAAVNDGDGWTGTGDDGSMGYIRASREINVGGEALVQFRVLFASDQASNNEGFAFDNIEITADPQSDNDVGIDSYVGPQSGALGSDEEITVVVKNFGNLSQDGFDISYQVDNGNVITENFDIPLEPGIDTAYTFSQTADLSELREYEIIVFTGLSNDQISSNDTVSVSLTNVAEIDDFPYSQDFDGSESFWTAHGENSSWEQGIPGGQVINSSSNSWVTNADGEYNVNERSFLISPGFNFSTLDDPQITFDLWYDTEAGSDGVVLQFSEDNGATWSNVGAFGDPVNWYNNTSIDFGNQSENGEAWSGRSGQFITVFHELSSLAGSSFVRFRLLFNSDGENQSDGIAIDNIKVFDATAVGFEIECGDDVVVDADNGQGFATIDLTNPTVSGAGDVQFYNDFNNSSNTTGQFLVGETTVNFLITSGDEVVTCDVLVTVEDNELPVIDCPDEIRVALPAGESSGVIDYPVPAANDNFGFPILVTYLLDATVDGISGVACPTGPNSYIRAFDLVNDFGIDTDFNLQSVDAGFQINTADAGDTIFNARVNVYAFDGQNLSINNSEEFVFDNFTLLSFADFQVDASVGNQVLSVPVNAVIPAGQTAVIELFTEVGSDITFPGANPDISGGTSYLLGPACGISEPTPVEDLDFPDAQWVIEMNGVSTDGKSAIQLSTGIGSGGEFPIGNNTETYSLVDFFGNETECSFDVSVVEATLDAPSAEDATEIGEGSFTANWSVVSGVSYELFVSTDNFETILPEFNGVEIAENSFALEGLSKNTAYQYRVRSVNDSDGLSQFSNTIQTSTLIEAPLLGEANNVDFESFSISWSPIPGIRDFEVDLSTDNFNTFVEGYDALVVEGTTVTIEDIDPVTTYQVRVRAINSGGQSDYSNTIEVSTLIAPPVLQPAFGITESSITISWNETADAIGYILELTDDDFNTLVPNFDSVTIVGTSLIIDGLEPNTSYLWRLRSLSTDSTLSLFSDIFRATTLASPPTALDPSDATSYGFRARWEPTTNVLTYELDVSSDNFNTFLDGFEARKVNGNSILIRGLDESTTLQYRIRSVNRTGVLSENSNVVSFTLPENTSSLSAPEALDATNVSSQGFVANWSAIDGALYYELDVSEDNFSSTVPEYTKRPVFDVTAQVESIPEATYEYRVRAVDNQGNSDFSNVISVVVEITSIRDFDEFGQVSVYPNPIVNRILNLSLSNDAFGKYQVNIFDIDGRLIQTHDFNKEAIQHNEQIRISNVDDGIYVLRLEHQDFNQVYRLIIKSVE
ncbi:MAG TPA: fibronectin type III domain-containing protein [Cyclobacteriaceae bacterium]